MKRILLLAACALLLAPLARSQQPVAPGTTPNTGNAALRCTLVSAASNNATNCKGSGRQRLRLSLRQHDGHDLLPSHVQHFVLADVQLCDWIYCNRFRFRLPPAAPDSSRSNPWARLIRRASVFA